MSLYKRAGSDRWVSEITINGQRYRRSTGTTDKRAAKVTEAQWRIDILTGRAVALSVPQEPQVRMLTVAEAVRRYQTEELEPRQQKAKTARSARYNLALIPQHFGADRPLDQITTADISEWRASMLAAGLAPASVNRRLSDLRAIMRKAVRWGVLQTLPQFDACKLPARRDRFLSDEEFDRIRQACPCHLHQLVTFLAGTGARLGEALDLCWEFVAPDCSSVTFTLTKNGRTRTVPCPQEVRLMLASLPRRRPDQPVFTYEGRPFADPKRAWQKARAKAGLPHVTLHGLRHYYCSRLVRRGVSLLLVQRLAGHSSPVMTSRYSHVAPNDLAQAVSVLD